MLTKKVNIKHKVKRQCFECVFVTLYFFNAFLLIKIAVAVVPVLVIIIILL